MQHAPAPCLNQDDQPLFPLLRTVWRGMVAVSAVHVGIAFDRPWANGQGPVQGDARP